MFLSIPLLILALPFTSLAGHIDPPTRLHRRHQFGGHNGSSHTYSDDCSGGSNSHERSQTHTARAQTATVDSRWTGSHSHHQHTGQPTGGGVPTSAAGVPTSAGGVPTSGGGVPTSGGGAGPGSSSSQTSTSNSAAPTTNPGPSPGGFTLGTLYQGASFLNGWDFFTGADPTNGMVDYINAGTASSANLAYVQPDGVTVLAVDSTSSLGPGQGRQSVRISSQQTFNGGLFIVDLVAMPTGCATWPAWWSVGPNWPNQGEIDIVEGVNTNTFNQVTLHTGPGCTLSPDLSATGSVLGTNCVSSGGDNSGCAYSDSDSRSFGPGFNANGGGVFAHLWDSTGINVWFFPRGSIPADVDAKSPNPSNWGPPVASFSFSTCDPSHFSDHVLVFDTTLCGDWAGAVYSSSGCPATCEEAIMDPSNFVNAKWMINYVAVYNQ